MPALPSAGRSGILASCGATGPREPATVRGGHRAAGIGDHCLPPPSPDVVFRADGQETMERSWVTQSMTTKGTPVRGVAVVNP